VDDGPAGVSAPAVNSKPGGRTAVWLGVLIVLAIALVAFFTHPRRAGDDRMVTAAGTQTDIERSTVPGTADRLEANRPVSRQGGG
jgi:hypothetical protein